ncbi:MAG: SDR family NAD(P)-dependent oxidoreductase [Sandaracinaceae bacterium]
MTRPKTILVTGSNSGLGLETARQLAERPEWQRIVLGARSEDKARGARDTLVAATGRSKEDFEYLIVDLNQPASVDAALDDADARDLHLDAVVMNAGGVVAANAEGIPKAESGLSQLFAMNVGGHARLVEGLLAANRVRRGATLVFAASEVSRGIRIGGKKAPVLPKSYPSLDEAIGAVARGEHVSTNIDDTYEYGLVKLLGIAWMSELAQRPGEKVRALSISPGATTGTAGAKGLPLLLAFFMTWIAMPLMRLFGQAHTVESGAARYIRGLEDPSLVNGGFYASADGGTSGRLVLQSSADQPLLSDDEFVAAVARLVQGIAREPQANTSAALAGAQAQARASA